MKALLVKNYDPSLIQRYLIYGFLGLTLEVIYTGLASLLAGDLSMHGFTYLIMVPIYGLAVFLEPLVYLLRPLPWWIRGLVYLAIIWSIEYLTGTLLRLLLGYCPWNYDDFLNVNGIITWRMAPEWFLAGLGFEKLFNFIKGTVDEY